MIRGAIIDLSSMGAPGYQVVWTCDRLEEIDDDDDWEPQTFETNEEAEAHVKRMIGPFTVEIINRRQ